MPEKDKKQCRACGKDISTDAAECEFCGWSDEKARAEVRKRRLLSEVEKEMEAEDKKTKRGSKSNVWGW